MILRLMWLHEAALFVFVFFFVFSHVAFALGSQPLTTLFKAAVEGHSGS